MPFQTGLRGNGKLDGIDFVQTFSIVAIQIDSLFRKNCTICLSIKACSEKCMSLDSSITFDRL